MEIQPLMYRIASITRVFDGEVGAGSPPYEEQGARAQHDRVGAVELRLVLGRQQPFG